MKTTPTGAGVQQSDSNPDMNTVSSAFSQILAQQAAARSAATQDNANPDICRV
jgi:hypothetical protein